MCRAICSPISACIRISACSASVSGPGLARTRSGIAILPMSCSSPASRQRAVKPGDSPSRSAIRPDSSPTCSACSGGIPSRRLADSASAVASAPPSGSSCSASTSRTSLASRVWLRPAPLGRVQRLVDGEQDRLAVRMPGVEPGRADRGGDVQRVAADRERVVARSRGGSSRRSGAARGRPARRRASTMNSSPPQRATSVVAPDATAQALGDLDQRLRRRRRGRRCR